MPATLTNVGTTANKSGSTSTSVTVPAEGVPVGAVLMLEGVNASSGSVSSVADSKGHTWNATSFSSGGMNVAAWVVVTTALVAGDTITWTHNSVAAKVLTVHQLVDATLTSGAPNVALTETTTVAPSIAGTTTAKAIILGWVGVNGPIGDAFTQDTDTDGGVAWTDLGRNGTTGGSATSNVYLSGAFKLVPAGTYTYDPAAASRSIGEGLYAFAEVSGSDTTAPTTTLGNQTRTVISRVPGWDAFDVTITANEPFVEYELRRVPSAASTRTEGSQIETAVVSSTTSLVVTVTDDELVNALASEGANTVKAFTKDAAGNWSS